MLTDYKGNCFFAKEMSPALIFIVRLSACLMFISIVNPPVFGFG